jgi:serine/threonine-protein kinase
LRAAARIPEYPEFHLPSSGRLPSLGTVVGGKYRIERLVGRGGMGAVYAAVRAGARKRVAVKLMLPGIARDPESRERLLREAQAAGRIRHANVVRVFEVGTHRGVPFLVMELLVGTLLRERMDEGPMPLRSALAIILPILSGVASAHRAGVVHRDLKPENVMLVRDRRRREAPKILDFGIAKLTGPQCEPVTSITRKSVVLGTPAFMAPEQLMGEPVDARADVYSLGVLLYAMLAGRRPFDAEGYNQLLFKIASEEPAGLTQLRPELPAAVEAIVRRAMARRPERRFGDVDGFSAALRTLGTAAGVRARAAGAGKASPASRGRRAPVEHGC